MTVKEVLEQFQPEDLTEYVCWDLELDSYYYDEVKDAVSYQIGRIYDSMSRMEFEANPSNTVILHSVMQVNGFIGFKADLYSSDLIAQQKSIRAWDQMGYIDGCYLATVAHFEGVARSYWKTLNLFQSFVSQPIEWSEKKFWTKILGASVLPHQAGLAHLAASLIATYLRKADLEKDEDGQPIPWYAYDYALPDPKCDYEPWEFDLYSNTGLYFEIMKDRRLRAVGTEAELPRVFREAWRLRCCESTYAPVGARFCPCCGKQLSTEMLAPDFCEYHSLPIWECDCGNQESTTSSYCTQCGKKRITG